MTGEGAVVDISSLSKTAAAELGRATYYEYVYPPPEREMQRTSETEFATSLAPGAIKESQNEVLRTTHYTAVVHTEEGIVTIDSLDPNRQQAQGYTVTEVRPLQEIPLR
jgi:hypothetical protein